MENQPEITVITATYNSSKTLVYTLKSILDQSFTNFEVWVIGDHCSDNTEEVVKNLQDQRLNYYNMPLNTGSQAFPNNEGIKRAKGKYIAYLGHDDLWFPSHLDELLKCIKQNGADLVHGSCILLEPSGIWGVAGPPSAGRNYGFHHVPPSCILHKKDVTEHCGFWEDPSTISEPVDMQFLGKIYRSGKKIIYRENVFVLKFPSANWKLYDRKDNFPQQKFYSDLKQDPSGLLMNLLMKVATLQSRYYFPVYTLQESIGHISSRIRGMIRSMGKRSAFLEKLLIIQAKRTRKKRRKLRGLKTT